jgi:hypothetical protein
MLTVGLGPYPMHKLYITEWNGLRVPAGFDCDIFYKLDERWDVEARRVMGFGPHEKSARPFWGNHHYFGEVPSRWFACYLHLADFKSANTLTSPRLPFIDDEYNEQVAVYQSVLRARKRFVVAELGCRWGTWGTRSIAMLRHAKPSLDYDMLLVEAFAGNCNGAREVLRINQMNATLLCEYAAEPNVREWAKEVPHIDLIDMDIQLAEAKLVPALMDLFNEKVYRLIIGTHSDAVHAQLVALFQKENWIFIANIERIANQEPLKKYLRTSGKTDHKWDWPVSHPDYGNWTRLLAAHRTPPAWHDVGGKGPVANADGEIIVDNPRFVRKGFSLTDTKLNIDDLL